MRNYTLEDRDCDNFKSIKTSTEECLQIFQTAVNEGDELTLPSARDAVLTSNALLTSAMDLVKGVINNTGPPAPMPGNATGPQRSIEIKSEKLPNHFEDAVNVLLSLQKDSPSMDARLSQSVVEKIV